MLQGNISILHILIIILTLQFETSQSPQQDRKKHNFKNSYQQPHNDESANEVKDVHCNSHNFLNFGIVKKIEYFPCSLYTNSCNVNVNLNSACVRCEICLSIVDKINQTLIFVHEQILPINYLNETQIESLFKIICEYSFTNYGLRNINGNRVIFDHISESNSIVTNVDEKWKQHLQKRCLDLTDQMGIIKLYKYWKFWWDNKNINEEILELEAVLCRGDSTFFRDCRSIAHRKRESLKNTENTRFKKKINEIFKCI